MPVMSYVCSRIRPNVWVMIWTVDKHMGNDCSYLYLLVHNYDWRFTLSLCFRIATCIYRSSFHEPEKIVPLICFCVCLCIWSSSTVKPEMASQSIRKCPVWRILGKSTTVSPSPSLEIGKNLHTWTVLKYYAFKVRIV